MSDPTAQPATLPFQAEVAQVLDLVIHSLYSHDEIFLRELVSNASDALDKLRFLSLTSPELLGGDLPLEIRISVDADQGTLTFEDTGVGMTREELIENLGTIAHSGSKTFLDELKKAGQQKDAQLIGQFGVGFYSAFLVSDRVEVKSRSARGGPGHLWKSDAKGTYTIEPLADGEGPRRGTVVTLHLKNERKEFLETWQLRELVSRYSDYVGHPIRLHTPKKGDVPAFDEVVNRASALWQRPKSEVKDEQYKEFYKHLGHDFEDPLAWTHFTAEGAQQFAGLLYLPGHAPFDLGRDAKKGVKLFVKRVLVLEDCEALLPSWLRFIRGVIDSDDLPLNVSREVLQDSKLVPQIKKQVQKRVLGMLEKLAQDRPDDYLTFWKAFGNILKEGLAIHAEDAREKLGALLRCESSTVEGQTSLEAYVSRMKDGQSAIYFAHGPSREGLLASPHLEGLRARGLEVLLFTEPVDEWALQYLKEFKGKPLVSAMAAGLELPPEEKKEEAEKAAADLKPLLEFIKKTLEPRVRDVRTSERLKDSPCCLVTPEGAQSPWIDELMRERGHRSAPTQRILELNPGHPLVAGLKQLHAANGESAELKDHVELLYEQAQFSLGGRIEDPVKFSARVLALLTRVVAPAPRAQA